MIQVAIFPSSQEVAVHHSFRWRTIVKISGVLGGIVLAANPYNVVTDFD